MTALLALRVAPKANSTALVGTSALLRAPQDVRVRGTRCALAMALIPATRAAGAGLVTPNVIQTGATPATLKTLSAINAIRLVVLVSAGRV